jgi:hypothetical protein
LNDHLYALPQGVECGGHDSLSGMFAQAQVESITFHNPSQGKPFTQTVPVARTAVTSNEVP